MYTYNIISSSFQTRIRNYGKAEKKKKKKKIKTLIVTDKKVLQRRGINFVIVEGKKI